MRIWDQDVEVLARVAARLRDEQPPDVVHFLHEALPGNR